MASETIGKAACPVCDSKGAKLSLTKAKLACLTCAACSSQIFARSGRSDELLRARLVDAPAPAEKKPAEKKEKAKDDERETVAAGGDDSWDPYK